MLGKRKLVNNSMAMLISRLTQSITTFILAPAITRFLGTEELGIYLLAFSYYFIFASLFSQGLKTLFIRELACEPKKIPVFLLNGTLLQLFLGIIGYVILVALVFALPYSPETSVACYIMGLTILPFVLSNITESVFLAQERMHLIAISTAPIYILRLIAMIKAMSMGYEIQALAIITLISEIVILIIQWFFLAPTTQIKWKINLEFFHHTICKSITFFAIDGISIVNSRLQIIILSLLGNELLLGLYGGVLQIIQPYEIVSQSIASAAFPNISKLVEIAKSKQRKFTESMIEILLLISLPMLVGLLFIGKDLLVLIYGDPAFREEASITLILVSLSLMFLPYIRIISFTLVANHFENINLYQVIISTFLNSTLGIFLILQYQLIGAGMTSTIIKLVSCIIYISALYRSLYKLHFWLVLRRPLFLSLLMVIVFVMLMQLQTDIIATVIISTCTYSILGLLIMIFSFKKDNRELIKLSSK